MLLKVGIGMEWGGKDGVEVESLGANGGGVGGREIIQKRLSPVMKRVILS